MRLEDKLRQLKIMLNSVYGNGQSFDMNKLSSIYEETSLIRDKIQRLKKRKQKIKKILQ